jgi:hypothetical protein
MLHDLGGSREGSVKRSHGYAEKVISNPVINTDTRNQALIGTADGVPLFNKEKNARNGLPFMVRLATAPDQIALKMDNAHLYGLLPGEFFSVDERGREFRTIRKPQTTQAAMVAITDDLLGMYNTGCWVVDQSLPAGHPRRTFRLRSVLLYWSVRACVWGSLLTWVVLRISAGLYVCLIRLNPA